MSHRCKTDDPSHFMNDRMSSSSSVFGSRQRIAPAAGLFGMRLDNPATRPVARSGLPDHMTDAEDRETFAGQFLAGTHARPATRKPG